MSLSLNATLSRPQIELGVCEEHNRTFECYSLQAQQAICPSCLMFGTYKGHEVISLEEANVKLRKDLDLALRQGTLKVENIQNVLLDIRHTILSCDEQKQKVMNDCSQKFKELIRNLKQRKAQLENEIDLHFQTQMSQLKNDEKKWEDKEQSCKDLLNCAKSQNDKVILQNSKKIVDTLDDLRQEKEFKKVAFINEVESDFKAANSKEHIIMNHSELQKQLEKHMKIGDAVQIQYRV